MKAATLLSFGSPLTVGAVPDPVAGTGEVVVDVVATGILPYTADVFSGARKYPLELPVVPGCGAVGRERTAGPDATRLAPGDWVFCDPTVRSRDCGSPLTSRCRAGVPAAREASGCRSTSTTARLPSA